MYKDEDIQWVSALHQGDMQAFEKLFEKYHAPLYYHVLGFAKSARLAEDVVQDVFVKVWENRKNLKTGFSFKAYLFSIGKNHIINILQRAARESHIRQEILSSAVPSHNSTEDEIILADYEEITSQAVAQLPPKRKEVFTMCRYEGKRYDEVAQTLNISKKTVQDHIFKAEKSIQKYFEGHANMTLRLFLLAGSWLLF
jgi:RNA polymerase sigma-70 factor (family 1)